MFHIWLDDHEWTLMLNRHEQVHPLVREALNLVLAEGFAQTQAITHVITGKLKASGSSSSSVHGDEWHGQVEYDAVHHGTIYAGYEQRRGGEHDFLAPMEAMDSMFEEAMFASVKG